MAGKLPPSAIACGLAAGTSVIGALLAQQAGQPNLLAACLLAAAFAAASLLFAKGEADKAQKTQKKGAA